MSDTNKFLQATYVDEPTRKKAIKKFKNERNYKNLDKNARARHRKYILALEKIANNTIQLPPPDGVLNTKDNNKPMVEKYYYFGARVRFGNKVFDIVFDAEKNKGENEDKPQVVHLYNITEKGGLVGHRAYTYASKMTRPPYNSTISQSEINVNNQSEYVFEQKAYVSMKGEHQGDSLDADRFEGTSEGAMVHGWGNCLLKDRKTNKIRYFDHWNERKVFDMLYSLSNI